MFSIVRTNLASAGGGHSSAWSCHPGNTHTDGHRHTGTPAGAGALLLKLIANYVLHDNFEPPARLPD